MSTIQKYKYGKIYKIFSKTSSQLYIGSTIMHLYQRLKQHLYVYRKWKNGENTPFLTSFIIFDLGNVEIELIEDYPCSSKQELTQRELYHIQNIQNCVNVMMSTKKPQQSNEAFEILHLMLGETLANLEKTKKEVRFEELINHTYWSKFCEIIQSLGYRHSKTSLRSTSSIYKKNEFEITKKIVNKFLNSGSGYKILFGKRKSRMQIRDTFVVTKRHSL